MSKPVKEIEKGAKNLYNSGKKAFENTYHAVGDVFDATGQILQGDVKGLGREISDFSKHASGAVTAYSETVSGVGIVSGGKISDVVGNTYGAMTSYGTGQISRGSDYLEAATGSDVFGRQAKAEAKAAAEAAAEEAKQASKAERLSQLRKLRRQITPLTRGMTGYASGSDDENYAGLVLG